MFKWFTRCKYRAVPIASINSTFYQIEGKYNWFPFWIYITTVSSLRLADDAIDHLRSGSVRYD